MAVGIAAVAVDQVAVVAWLADDLTVTADQVAHVAIDDIAFHTIAVAIRKDEFCSGVAGQANGGAVEPVRTAAACHRTQHRNGIKSSIADAARVARV